MQSGQSGVREGREEITYDGEWRLNDVDVDDVPAVPDGSNSTPRRQTAFVSYFSVLARTIIK